MAPFVVSRQPRSLGPKVTSKNERSRTLMTEAALGPAVLRFGAPLVVGMILHTAFNLIDMFMVSRLDNGSAALAALGICDMVAAMATILSNGVSTAAVALIARHLGAGHLTGVRRTTWQSLWLVGLLSVVFGLLGVVGSDFVVRTVMQAKGEAADLSVAYLQVSLGGCFSIFFLLQITAILRALGHAKSAAALLVGGNALNIVLNVFFIYGSGPAPEVFSWGGPVAEALGIPRMGVVGAAWATLIGRTVPVAIGAFMLVRRRGGPKFHRVYLRPVWRDLRALLVIGWPASAQLVLRVVVVLFFISLINGSYTSAADQSTLTAYAVCLRLETLALFIGMGWGAAASSFVGTNLGALLAGRAKAAGFWAAGYNVTFMVALATLYVAFGGDVVAFFDADAAVVAAGDEYLGVVAWSYVLLGVGLVLSQAMTGAGATLSAMLVDAAVLLLFVVPTAYVVAETLGLPRSTLWQVIAAGNAVGAVAYVTFYSRGSFLKKNLTLGQGA